MIGGRADPIKRVAVVCERDRGYGRSVCLGIAAAAEREGGWMLEFLDFVDAVPQKRLAGFDGVIARISNDRMASDLAKSMLPVVDVYCAAFHKSFGSVDGDQQAIGRMAAGYFLGRRYVNFAYCGYDGIGFSDVRRDAFAGMLAENGFSCDVFHAPKGAVDEFGATVMRKEAVRLGSDAGALASWVKSLPPGTAIFCCHDVRAWQVLAVCRAEGISVPGRVAVLGVDNDKLVCSFTDPMISSIDNSPFIVGKTAVSLLSRMFRSPEARKSPPHLAVRPVGVCSRASTPFCAAGCGRAADMLEYVSRHVADGVRAEDVAKLAGCSVKTVEREIKAATGLTLNHHIIETRMETAKNLLLFSESAISEVARMSGFSSPQYFSRFFKMKTGTTPVDYRENAYSENNKTRTIQ